MIEQMLTCPHCKKEFPMTEALSHQLRESLALEIRTKVEDEQGSQLEQLREQLESEKQKRKKAENAELGLRKEREKLQDEKDSWELAKQRELDAEKNSIRKEVAAHIQEEHAIENRTKDELIANLRKDIQDLKQKVEQGSQQIQGEIPELILEDFLRAKFPLDIISPVPTGTQGVDLIQTVRNEFGYECGKIVWESKHTKQWNDKWIDKLKADQRDAKANIAVIVSKALPKTIGDFGYVNEIWVTQQTFVQGLATALRMSLIQVNATKRAAENKEEKFEDLYDYFTSLDFHHRIKSIVDSFTSMKTDLDAEKRAVQKLWKKRETQIERITEATLDISGVLEAILGGSMMQIDNLELVVLSDGVKSIDNYDD